MGGRLDVRETLEHPQGGIWAGEITIPAARIELGYRWKKRLRAVMEFDVRGDIKDAFIWLKIGKGLSTRAGRFKVPLSLVERESATRLPLVRRGLLRDVLNDALGLTGRSTGAQLEWKCSHCTRELKVQAGCWQTRDPDSKVALERGLGLVSAIRGTWELGSVEVGASALYQPKGSSPGGDESSWIAGVDARHTLELDTGALRTWAEALTGRMALIGGTGNALLGRAVSAWRLGGLKDGKPYVEPFLMLSAMDPDLDSPDDLLWEGTLGLNAGQWRRWRVQAQFEVRKAGAGVASRARGPGRESRLAAGSDGAIGGGLLMSIVFEGIDGSGKTTLSNRVAQELRQAGLRVRHVREGGTLASAVSEDLRRFTRDPAHLALTSTAELLLYAAREAQLLEEVTRPALAEYEIVITDRFLYTAEVLARRGRGLPEHVVRPVLDASREDLVPDRVFLMDVDPALAKARRRISKILVPKAGAPSRKGLAGAGLQVRLRSGYRTLAAESPERWTLLENAGVTLEHTCPAGGAGDPPCTRGSPALRAHEPSCPSPVRSVEEARERFLRHIDAWRRRSPPRRLLPVGDGGGGHDGAPQAPGRAMPGAGGLQPLGLRGPGAWQLREAAGGHRCEAGAGLALTGVRGCARGVGAPGAAARAGASGGRGLAEGARLGAGLADARSSSTSRLLGGRDQLAGGARQSPGVGRSLALALGCRRGRGAGAGERGPDRLPLHPRPRR